jgi:hypothetical protein
MESVELVYGKSQSWFMESLKVGLWKVSKLVHGKSQSWFMKGFELAYQA